MARRIAGMEIPKLAPARIVKLLSDDSEKRIRGKIPTEDEMREMLREVIREIEARCPEIRGRLQYIHRGRHENMEFTFIQAWSHVPVNPTESRK